MLPLSGIKVVDMSQVYMGPGAAVYLADQGAEVIKVEPLEGETNRRLNSSPELAKHGFGKAFLSLNRNKRSIALEIRSPEGQEIAHRLAKWADAFILNFRPGAESRVHLDYETLAAINPRLIYAAVSAFGREGPDASMPGYDIVLQARSGILSARRNSDGIPLPASVMVSDMSGCIIMAYAIAVALIEREKTGKGQRVDTSLLHNALAMQMQQMVWVEGNDEPISGYTNSALAACYPCSDGELINIVVMETHQWRTLCRVLEIEHLAEDPSFATYDQRASKAVELGEVFRAVFETRPLAYWLERLKAGGVPCSTVAAREVVPQDPQAIANRMFCEQDHPAIGRVKMVSPPFHLSNTSDEPRLRRPAPTLGQHTKEVLGELGYDEGSIADLYQRGVIR